MASAATFLEQYLGDSLLLLLLASSAIAFFVGLAFLFMPSKAFALNSWLSRHYSLRRSTRPLEISYQYDSVIYRHHKGAGLFLVIGASYVLYQLGFNYQQHEIATTLSGSFTSYLIVDWILTALLWFSIPAMLLIALFGCILATRPSTLKGVEGHSNRWISTRRWLLPWETSHAGVDLFVQRHLRKFGLVVLLLSSYSLTVILILYLSKHSYLSVN